MGLPVLPSGTPGGPAARGRAPPDVKKSLEWDFYYPIDIRVSWSSIYFISKLYRENENLKDQTQDLFIIYTLSEIQLKNYEKIKVSIYSECKCKIK